MQPRGTCTNGWTRLLPLLMAAGSLSACGAFQNVPLPAPVVLTAQVTQILDVDGPTPDFYRERSRLEGMGAELDQVLINLIDDGSASETVRANAEILLADRRSALALPVLRRALLTSGNESVRTGALLGLQRLAPEIPDARNAILAAVGDPSPQVRVNVLQSLDVEDAALLRRLLEFESDAQVRIVARQLLGLLEARGAPLVRDRTGDYRTTAVDSAVRIVFHPVSMDSAADVATGALWVEVPGRSLVPLAQDVEVVGGVVPAFVAPGGGHVVFETHREIQIRDLRDGTTRVVGPGVAPRPIPFTDRFVYLRPVPGPRAPAAQGGTVLAYDVLRTAFDGGAVDRLGQLRAVAQPGEHGNASPVRRMVVGEVREGFELQGAGIANPFALPSPFEGAARPGAPPAVAPRPACAAGERTKPAEHRRRWPWQRRRPPPPPPPCA